MSRDERSVDLNEVRTVNFELGKITRRQCDTHVVGRLCVADIRDVGNVNKTLARC